MTSFPLVDQSHMRRALELARRGEGHVEPNPMVGCVIADGPQIVAEGWHQQFGGPHAEVVAIQAAGTRAAGTTLYVTLEPCCHHGKTPPCTDQIIAAHLARVVISQQDPFDEVQGQGILQLREAGLQVESGLLSAEASFVLAPYEKLIHQRRPWVLAKWAMTLDGRIASRTGSSQWISGESSREVAHALRGRVDAILVGRRTVDQDDPLLTARPPGPRVSARHIVDTQAYMSQGSQKVRTVDAPPVRIAVCHAAPEDRCRPLEAAGCQLIRCQADSQAERLTQLLDELGRRKMTNLLVEGGGQLLGALFDQKSIDEVHVFMAPKLVGGEAARSPILGAGIESIDLARQIDQPVVQRCGDDVYIQGRVKSEERGAGSKEPGASDE